MQPQCLPLMVFFSCVNDNPLHIFRLKMSKGQENENKVLRLKSPAGAELAIYRWPLPRYVCFLVFCMISITVS